VRDYELVLVLSPAIEEERVHSTIERIHRIITERGGAIINHATWGVRRLAYPIKGFKEGNYFLTQFKLEAGHTRPIVETLRVTEEVLRHLLVKAEPTPQPAAAPAAAAAPETQPPQEV
jgi:small subunit ribosomal protein S6